MEDGQGKLEKSATMISGAYGQSAFHRENATCCNTSHFILTTYFTFFKVLVQFSQYFCELG